MSKSTRVAVIGLGHMGLPMAERLIAAGHAVAGYDVDATARERATAAGVAVAATAGAAVEACAAVILVLPHSGAVESVLRDPAVVSALSDGTLVIDMSSSEPLRTRVLAGELAAQGVRMIDAPVSGGVKGARSGTLTIMAGGRPGDVDYAMTWLRSLGDVVRTGDIGSGHAMKALNNLLSATHLLATSEAMLVGERLGLDATVMLTVFNRSSGKSGSTENKFPNYILPRTYNSGFALRLMVKDMQIALGLAEAAGTPCELSATAVKLWTDAANELPPDADHTEIERWMRSRVDVTGAAI